MRRRKPFSLLAIGVLVITFGMTQPAFAIRPVVIMFYGEPLRQPVFLTDTMVFHDLENPTAITSKDVAGREYLRVAMFWGTQWNQYLSGERPLRSLTPEMASQHGRFYPATSDRSAVLLQTKPQLERMPIPEDPSVLTWGGVLDASWIDGLVARGVPAKRRPQ
jgi:hypothetical protein